MQLSMQVDQQQKIIDALSKELMDFETRQQKLEEQMEKIINNQTGAEQTPAKTQTTNP
jgi:uncharacterized coiled-coil protein SlyX